MEGFCLVGDFFYHRAHRGHGEEEERGEGMVCGFLLWSILERAVLGSVAWEAALMRSGGGGVLYVFGGLGGRLGTADATLLDFEGVWGGFRFLF